MGEIYDDFVYNDTNSDDERIYKGLNVSNPSEVASLMENIATKGDMSFLNTFVPVFADILSIAESMGSLGIIDVDKQFLLIKSKGKNIIDSMGKVAREAYLAGGISTSTMPNYKPASPSPIIGSETPGTVGNNPKLINQVGKDEVISRTVEAEKNIARTRGETAYRETISKTKVPTGTASKTLSAAAKEAGLFAIAYGFTQVVRLADEAHNASILERDSKVEEFKSAFGGWLGGVCIYVGTEMAVAAAAGGTAGSVAPGLGNAAGAAIGAIVALVVSFFDIFCVLMWEKSLGDLLYLGIKEVVETTIKVTDYIADLLSPVLKEAKNIFLNKMNSLEDSYYNNIQNFKKGGYNFVDGAIRYNSGGFIGIQGLDPSNFF